MGIWRAVPDEETIEEAGIVGSASGGGAGIAGISVAHKKDAATAGSSEDDLIAERKELAVARSANQSEETLDDDSTEQLNSNGGRPEASNLLQNVAALS